MPKKYVLKRTNKTGLIKPEIDESRFTINYRQELNVLRRGDVYF
jgi:hypothetical protein